MLIFTKFKNGFFLGATFINCFRIFKWMSRESLLHRVYGVHRKAGIGVQINNLETQEVLITLIQFYFNVKTLKQRWTNVISTSCLQGNCLETYQENIYNGVEECNLSKTAKFNFIALHLMKPPKSAKSYILLKRLWIVASTS